MLKLVLSITVQQNGLAPNESLLTTTGKCYAGEP